MSLQQTWRWYRPDDPVAPAIGWLTGLAALRGLELGIKINRK